jgi:D-alanyl-D-alanine carboxypeptidase/D-alanyl-D-alanine-endopeptidase (penicillin-binding protein 4)
MIQRSVSKNSLSLKIARSGAVLLSLLYLFVMPLSLIAAAQSATPQQSVSQQTETLESLRARLAAHLSTPRYTSAAWGVKVLSLDTGVTLFEHNGDKYFSPASNTKLYTAALALDRLGTDFRVKTSLYATARPDADGRIKGDLIVYGRGDPSIAATWNEGDYFRGIEPLVSSLVAAGVKQIDGDLVGDESYFIGPPFGSGWEWDDLQWYYGAEVSALSINDNSIDLFVNPADRAGIACKITTGPVTPHVTIMNRTQTVAKGMPSRISVYRPVGTNIIYVSGTLAVGDKGYTGYVAVSNPAALFVSLFKEAITRRGIVIKGRTRTVDAKYREIIPLDFKKVVEIGSIESPSLKEIVRKMMKPSQNLYAQMLLLQVGASLMRQSERPVEGSNSLAAEKNLKSETSNLKPQISGPHQTEEPDYETTEEAGIDALNSFLASVGVRKGDVMIEEGSGLSRRNIITPTATVELLKFMSRHRLGDIYLDALPIAGVDGTLEKRMRETPAAGNVRAKTGSLRYVHTLSGYVTTAAGERLAFSIMVNNAYSTDRTVSPRQDIDALVLMLATFSGRSRQP